MRSWEVHDSEVDRLQLKPLKLPKVKKTKQAILDDALMSTARVRLEQQLHDEDTERSRHVDKPWPSYDLCSVKKIVRLAEELGCVDAVIQYELAHLNRVTILEALGGEDGYPLAIVQA